MTDPDTAVARIDTPESDLTAPPAFDTIDPRRLVLIKSQIAPRATDGEVAHFLELCHHYGLDPFAREAWCAKSEKGDRLLIMVGRDGLRKIAQRQGIHVDGDVVRAKDEIQIVRTPDGNRTVAHSYGTLHERGEIVGAWAECRMAGPTGVPLGYFFAPVDEYRPANPSSYSPWSKQLGVMILAAAERQAIRQATPLGGLLAEGEDESMSRQEDVTDVTDGGDAGPLPDDVEAVIALAAEKGHQGLTNREAAALAVGGRPQPVIDAWVAQARSTLDAIPEPEPEPEEAEVVDPLATLEGQLASIAESITAAENDGDDDRLAELVAERDALTGAMDAASNPDQSQIEF